MTEQRDGGPAFPATTHNDNCANAQDEFGSLLPPGGRLSYPGMSLRDYLAAKAMQGDLSSWPGDAGSWVNGRDELARRYYLVADAMLMARSARPAGGDE